MKIQMTYLSMPVTIAVGDQLDPRLVLATINVPVLLEGPFGRSGSTSQHIICILSLAGYVQLDAIW